MPGKNPEEELRELLANYPPWVKRILWMNPSPANLRPYPGLQEKFEAILRRIPDQWHDYCRAKRNRGLRKTPRRLGRSRKDTLAEEAQQLKREGRSYAQIAIALKLKFRDDSINKEQIRALVRSRKRQPPPPDKT